MTRQPSPILLRRLLRYEPETGKLFWRPRALSRFASAPQGRSWNTRYAGKEAFTSDDGKGYKIGHILYCLYKAHRVIWAMQTGEWPKDQVDHRDLDRANNRWVNLREATYAQNNCNTGKRSDNTSGYKGVSWDKRSGKWLAQIKYEGRKSHIGLFTDLEDAANAYLAAAAEHHGEFANA